MTGLYRHFLPSCLRLGFPLLPLAITYSIYTRGCVVRSSITSFSGLFFIDKYIYVYYKLYRCCWCCWATFFFTYFESYSSFGTTVLFLRNQNLTGSFKNIGNHWCIRVFIACYKFSLILSLDHHDVYFRTFSNILFLIISWGLTCQIQCRILSDLVS